MNKIYLIDFDGTITLEDTIVNISQYFYPEKTKLWWKKLKNGEYSIKDWIEAFQKEFDIDEKDYMKCLDDIEIDETFIKFIQNKEVRIVSGGFDYNINYILNKYAIVKPKIYANKFEYISSDKIKITMNYFDKRYSYSAVSKELIVEKYKKNYDDVVLIGDGITDIGAAKIANRVYAKSESYLEKKLKELKIVHKTFKNFDEIENLEGNK